MKKYINGKYIDMTAEEIAARREEAAKNEAEARKRPMSESEITRLLITAQINTMTVDDQTALRMLDYYPAWEELAANGYTAEKAGFKFRYGGMLYKTIPEIHTFATSWVPDTGTESLYTRIDEEHDGSRYDPIPYEGNMALTAGLYYSQYGAVYLCSRDTVNPVYAALAELVGIYAETAE